MQTVYLKEKKEVKKYARECASPHLCQLLVWLMLGRLYEAST